MRNSQIPIALHWHGTAVVRLDYVQAHPHVLRILERHHLTPSYTSTTMMVQPADYTRIG